MSRVRYRAITALVALAALAGCGSPAQPDPTTLRQEGRSVFRSAGCGGCHALAAAGTRGPSGPDFDTSEKLTRGEIIQQLNAGNGGMRSFRSRLSDRQETAVAEFLFAAMHAR